MGSMDGAHAAGPEPLDELEPADPEDVGLGVVVTGGEGRHQHATRYATVEVRLDLGQRVGRHPSIDEVRDRLLAGTTVAHVRVLLCHSMNVAALHESGRARWPTIDVPLEDFATYVAERSPSPAHAPSLYLACACARGDARAVAAFEETYFAAVRVAIGRVAADDGVTDEAIQRLRERLFVADGDGRPPGIAGYAGRGDLRGWLRVAAIRITLSLLRSRRPGDGDGELDRITAADPDPEVAMMRREYGEEANHALRAAFAELDVRARNLLRQHFVDGLGIDALGRLYGVHRATAARWLEKARQTLEKRTRALLVKRLGVGGSTVDSIVRMLHSDLRITLSGA
jgi:RNA polymerase sigma-70 factor (ECF subfamily)